MKKLKIKITLTEFMLGMSPNNEDIYAEFIASKAPDAPKMEEEIESIGVDAVVEKGLTVFPRNENGEPIMWDYQMRGFFKDACGMLSRVGGKGGNGKKAPKNESGKMRAFKKIIDGLIFVNPRQIVIHLPEGCEIDYYQRPLRAMTMQGERIALAISERIPAGSWMECEIVCLEDSHLAAVLEWLDYGQLRGIGQWRNSGAGRFTYEIIEMEEE